VGILIASRQGNPVRLAVALALGGLALNIAIYPTLAGIAPLWPAKPLAALAAQYPDCSFSVAGYAEPSLVFLTDNRVQFQSVEDIAVTLASPGCHLVALPAGAPPAGLAQLGAVQGLDLGTGHKVDLAVYLKR
jgi:hypothetical protein